MQVNVTQFRHNLFNYLNKLSEEPLELTLKGTVIARILPPEDSQEKAIIFLKKLRETARISEESDDLSGVMKASDWSVDEDDHIGY